MPLPPWLGRMNRRLTNPVLWPIASRMPGSGFGRIVHVGRRSGRLYRTPMLAFSHEDRLVFALTYGPRTEWVRNVLASGECRFETRRGTRRLVEPRLFRDPERRFVPPMVGRILGWLHADHFLEMRIGSETRGSCGGRTPGGAHRPHAPSTRALPAPSGAATARRRPGTGR